MSLLFCDSFDHYSDADILTKWVAAVPGVPFTLGVRQGRLGSSAAVIDTTRASPPACRVDLAPHAPSALWSAGTIFLCGFALRPLVMPDLGTRVVLCSVQTTGGAPDPGAYYLLLHGDGSLEIRRGPDEPILNHSAPGLDGAYICSTAAGVIDLDAIDPSDDDTVPYIEWGVRMDSWVQPPTSIVVKRRGTVANALTEWNNSAARRLLANGTALGGGQTSTYNGFTLGYAGNPAGAKFAISDVYVLDGYVGDDRYNTTTGLGGGIGGYHENGFNWQYTYRQPPQIIDCGSFLGDTKIDVAFPIDRASPTNGPLPLPWDTTDGSAYGLVLRHHPVDDTAYASAGTVGQADAAPYLLKALESRWQTNPTSLGSVFTDVPLFAVMKWFRAKRLGATITVDALEGMPGALGIPDPTPYIFAGGRLTEVQITTDFLYHGIPRVGTPANVLGISAGPRPWILFDVYPNYGIFEYPLPLIVSNASGNIELGLKAIGV